MYDHKKYKQKNYAIVNIPDDSGERYEGGIPIPAGVFPKTIDEVKKPGDKEENIDDYKETDPETNEPIKIYGSKLPGEGYKLTFTSVENVYGGAANVNYAGIVDMKDKRIHLLPSGRKDNEQYIGAKYPGEKFGVQTEKRDMYYEVKDAPMVTGEGRDRVSMHQHAVNMVAGRPQGSKDVQGNERYLGFSFAPEVAKGANDNAGRYALHHFHGRSRTLNEHQAPGESKSGIYAADYLMTTSDSGGGSRIKFKPVLDTWYRKQEEDNQLKNPGSRPMYGDSRKAAKGTLSRTIGREIQEVIIEGLTQSDKYDIPANADRAKAIYLLSQQWKIPARPPRSLLPLPGAASGSSGRTASPASLPATPRRERSRRPSVSLTRAAGAITRAIHSVSQRF